MKKFLAMIALVLGGMAPALSADWTDSWFNSHTTTSAGGYQTQERGYYTLGSFQGRYNLRDNYLVSTQPPSYRVGCGGIDLFGGGFSFMDPEYLVETGERIIQAAPAFAFNLALQTFCKECLQGLEWLKSVSDQLNQSQIQECRLSKALATYPVDMAADALGKARAEVGAERSVGDSLRKNWQGFQDAMRGAGNTLPDDIKPLVDGCPADFKALMSSGSVVKNMTDMLGVPDFADSIRGLIGDVRIEPTATDFSIRSMSPCPGNDSAEGSDFVTGEFEWENINGACSSAGSRPIIDLMEERLLAISAAMAAGTPLTAADLAFIEESPLPVYAALRDAVIAKTVGATIMQLREPLAYMYAHKVVDDLLKVSVTLTTKARELQKNSEKDPAAAGDCNKDAIAQAAALLGELREDALSARKALHANYQKKVAQAALEAQMARELYERRKQVLTKQATPLTQ